MKQPFLSIVLVVKDDARDLPRTLIDLDRHLSTIGRSYEILVADRGSKDGTADLLKHFGTLIAHLRTIDVGGSELEARNQALLAARGLWRATYPSDMSISIVEIEKAIRFFDESTDIVVGVRRTAWNSFSISNMIAGISQKDPYSPVWIYRADVIESLFGEKGVGKEASPMLLSRIIEKNALRCKEFPVFGSKSADESGLLAFMRSLWQALFIRFRL